MAIRKLSPLSGAVVIDLTELLPGPYATLLMQQLGATVIKIEKPSGDACRVVSPGMFRILNAGKDCRSIDLKKPEGLAQLEALVRTADVLVEGFRPGVMARLGLGPDRLLQLNSRLVAVSISGYGQSGPLRDDPGHDINYAALAGVVAISGKADGPPAYESGLPVADLAGSMFALTAVLGGLLERDKTGRGAHVDVAIADSLLHWMTPRIGGWQHATGMDAAAFKQHLHARPSYGVFRAACGRWFTLGALETPFWKRLVEAMALDQFRGAALESFDARCDRQAEIHSALQEQFERHDRDHWIANLRAADVPVAPVNDVESALRDPQFAERAGGSGQSVRFPDVGELRL